MAPKEDDDSTPRVSDTPPQEEAPTTTTTTAPGVNKRPAPDGGWGWLVVLGVCIGQLIWGFIVKLQYTNFKAFGVTYLILLDKFGASATATIWIGAITLTCTLAIGPLASALCRRFGCRCVSMGGAAILVTGVIATGHAPNIYIIYVTYSLMTGLGLGLIYTPGFIIISQYFDKRKALALSLTSVANGASTLIFPPLLLLLDREYGFSGMFLLMGGVCLHLFVGASLYRPLNPKAKSSKSSSALGNAMRTKSICCCTSKRSLSVEDKDYDLKDECLTNVQEDKTLGATKEKTIKERYASLFKNSAFVAFAFVSMLLSSEASMISSLLPAIAVDHGVDETKAAFLIAITGISRVAGSLVLGHLFDVRAIRQYRRHIYAGWCVVLGVGVLLMGVVSTYPAYVTLAVITGTATGLLLPQTITIIGDIVGETSDMEGFGVTTFVNAFGGLFGRAIAGPIKDYSGQYNLAYLLVGGVAVTAALLFEVVVIRRDRAQRRQQQTNTQSAVVTDT